MLRFPLEYKYDTLDLMLPEQTPGAWQIGWDLKDAFFNTGRWAEHADYMGLQDTETGEFYTQAQVRAVWGVGLSGSSTTVLQGPDHGAGQGRREQELGNLLEK